MIPPDPDGMTLLEKVVAAAVAVITPLWGIHAWIDTRFNKKADKADVTREREEDRKAIANCTRHIEKLYENAEDDRALTRDLHDKAMERIADTQKNILDAIGKLK